MLASANRTGAKANVGGEFPSLSGSGRYVAFQSQSTNLAPADRNRRSDIYVKDLLTGRIALVDLRTGELTVVSTGNAGSGNPALSADGRQAAFDSAASNFDPADNGRFDYDSYLKSLCPGTA